MKTPVEFRKRDIINSVAMIGFCLVLLACLHFGWARTVRRNVGEINQKIKIVQTELVGYRKAIEKLERLSEATLARQDEIKALESYFPSRGEILDIYGEIHHAALTYNVGINEVERGGFTLLKAGFLKGKYRIELIGAYEDLLRFTAHFDSDRRPIYFSRKSIKALPAEEVQINLEMVVYGLEREGSPQ